MRFNIFRPIMLILIAYTAKTLVETVGLMFGLGPFEAENLGYMAMIIAGITTYILFLRQSRKK